MTKVPFRKNQLNNRAQTTLTNMEKLEKSEKYDWFEKRDLSIQQSYTDSILNILEQKHDPEDFWNDHVLRIDSETLRTPLHYSMRHLPKIKDWNYKTFNFSFGNNVLEVLENKEKMIKSEKKVLAYLTNQFKKGNNEFDIIRLYLLAPQLETTNLPIIYSLDILKNKTENICGIRANAIVGGYVDGICQLFQIILTNENTARFYELKSGKTAAKVNPYDDENSISYTVSTIENLTSYDDAIKLMFEKFNICEVIERLPKNSTNVYEIMHSFKNSKDILAPINGNDFIKEIETRRVSAKENQMQHVYDKKGKQRKSVPMRRISD